MMNDAVSLPFEALADLCHRYPVRALALFGAMLRQDCRPDSDVDLLISFATSAVCRVSSETAQGILEPLTDGYTRVAPPRVFITDRPQGPGRALGV
jgi:predicted nucleotidyltransferase